MQNNSYYYKPSFLEKIDIFGVAINIRFNTLPTHTTRFGGLITIIIIFIILFYAIQMLTTLITQSSLQVIYSDDYVYQPEPFQIKPNKFNFAFGFQDANFIQYMDKSIYNVKATLQTMKKQMNQTTGQYDKIWSYKELQLVVCTEDNFQIQQSKEYFLKEPFHLMYCFKPDEEDAIIEGEFSALIYKSISIDFYENIDNDCASQEIKNQFLSKVSLGLFMSNNIIQIQDKYNPTKPTGKNLYWSTGPQMQKQISISLVNNYINSDFGYYRSDIKKQRVVSYSSAREQVLPRTSNVLFNLLIVYEKNREINYYRKYLKLDEAFSQLGGMFNGLLAIGFLICKPFSKLELNRKLLNSIFNIKECKDSDDKNNKDKLSPEINSIQNKVTKQEKNSLINEKESNTIIKSQNNLQVQNNDPLQRSKDMLKSIRSQVRYSTKKQGDLFNLEVKNIFQIQFSELQMKFKDYILNYISFCKRFQTSKQKLINFGTNKMYHQIDISYMINKMIEIEKLKHLLLNENQIKLFEYLPRPQINIEEVLEQEVKEEYEKKQKKIKKLEQKNQHQNHQNDQKNINNQTFSQMKIEEIRSPKLKCQKEEINQFTIFNQEGKTPMEKAQDAQKAFNQISKYQGHRSAIDEKLIRMLNPKLVNMFMENSFDFALDGIVDSSDETLLKSLEKSSKLTKKSQFKKSDHHKIIKLNRTPDSLQLQQQQQYYKEDFKQDNPINNCIQTNSNNNQLNTLNISLDKQQTQFGINSGCFIENKAADDEQKTPMQLGGGVIPQELDFHEESIHNEYKTSAMVTSFQKFMNRKYSKKLSNPYSYNNSD